MNNKTSGGGMSLCGVLLVVFIVLKLVNVISWSWWWVLSPLWIPFALIMAFVFLAFIISIIVH